MSHCNLTVEELIGIIKEAAEEVHSQLAPGYYESVYQRAMLIELQNRGLKADSENTINVFYKGQCVGNYRSDIIVENKIIVELKAVQMTTTAHSIQLVNYLQSTGIEHGLLINFGSPRLFIMHKTRDYLKNS